MLIPCSMLSIGCMRGVHLPGQLCRSSGNLNEACLRPAFIRQPLYSRIRGTGDRSPNPHAKRLTSTERVIVIGGESGRRENVAIGQPDVA